MSFKSEMMDKEIAISVKGLGKCYQIFSSPKQRLLQGLIGGRKKLYKEFWALRDVSFELKKGN